MYSRFHQRHFRQAMAITVLMGVQGVAMAQASAFDAAFETPSNEEPFRLARLFSVQMMHERSHLYPETLGSRAERSSIEARLDVEAGCEQGWCDGLRIVAKPRLWLGNENQPDHVPAQKPGYLPQAYLQMRWDDGAVGAGQHVLGWGPSMLYSPTNRLFPDNGALTPRKDLSGKPMVFGSVRLSGNGRLHLALANPHLDEVPGVVQGKGPFGLFRGEWNWYGGSSSTVGLVIGGGGAFRPYWGAYGEHGLTDAVTVSAEIASSRGYARADDPGMVLRQGQTDRLRWDGVLGIRYGFPSGAEMGAELAYNGYAMTANERAMPALSVMPSGGHKPSRNRAMHPYVQKQYLLLQTTWPKLFGDRRWGLIGRWLQGLDHNTSDMFIELSYSPTDELTLYLGVSKTRVGEAMKSTRAAPRGWYGAILMNF